MEDGDRVERENRAERGEVVWRAHGGRRLRVLAHSGSGSKPLVLSDRHIYWADDWDNSITRLPKDGGVPLVIATDQGRATALLLHEGFLYWACSGSKWSLTKIVRMAVDGDDIETLAEGEFSVHGIAVSGDDVFWTDLGDGLLGGAVYRGSVRGTPPVRIASKQKQPHDIAVDGENLFWVNRGNKRPTYFTDGSIARMPRAGGTKRWLIAKDISLPSAMVLDGGDAYWSTSTTIVNPLTVGGIWKRSAGGEKTHLAQLAVESAHLAVDRAHVYCLAGSGGSMYRIPKGGGEPVQLLSSLVDHYMPTMTKGFAVDDEFVYWSATYPSEAGGAIWKMPK